MSIFADFGFIMKASLCVGAVIGLFAALIWVA